MNRREYLCVLAGGAAGLGAGSAEPIVETHVHLFSDDLVQFPGHQNAWKPNPAPLEQYLKFAGEAGIAHSIHVSAEPYQDDLRYLEYTLQRSPKGFLKGTLLLDPTLPETPTRMSEYARRHPAQITALRVHCTRRRDEAPTVGGPIRDRDLMHPNVRTVWKKAGELNIAIQAHIQPWFAADIAQISVELPETRVIIDHFGHAGVGKAVKGPAGWELSKAELGYGDPKDFDQVLRLAKLRHVTLKVSGLQYSSRQAFPHRDVRPLARRAFDVFGPDRMMWGSFGHTMNQFKQVSEIFDANFDFLSAADRAKIRGLTASRVLGFPG